MPERKAVDYHDIQLDSGEDTPTTSVKLMLAENKQGGPLWKEGRLKPLPMRISQGEIRYAHFDPLRDLVFSQKSWHGGALQQIENPSKLHRYLQANGLDMRHEGVATLGMARSQQISIILPNEGWESGAASGWTLTPGTIGGLAEVNTTYPRTGVYALQLGHNAAGTESTAVFSIINYASWAGRSVTFGVWCRRNNDTTPSGGDVRIADGVGDSLTSFSWGAGDLTYKFFSVTHTINVAPTQVQLQIRTGGGASAQTIHVDDAIALISGNDTCVGLAEAKGKLYTAVGPLILRWNETNDFWESVYCQADGAQATDIISFNDRIYVAYGYS